MTGSTAPQGTAPPPETAMSSREKWGRGVLAVVLLYLFLIGVGMLEDGIAQMGEGVHEAILDGVRNPIAGLFAGILATIVVQSSSVSTSSIVGMVAAGVIPVEFAVPMIMGANIGTTVTNTLVTLGSIKRREEFGRVFTAATMHDLFNFTAVAILLPLELLTGVLTRGAEWLGDRVEALGLAGADIDGPIELLTAPVNELIESGLGLVLPEGGVLGTVLLVGGVGMLYVTINFVVKNLKAIFTGPLQRKVDETVSKGAGVAGIGVGAVGAVAMVSSTIVTVTLIPIVAAKGISVRNAYPITIGANLGTTLTGVLAALATGEPAALVIAFVHVLFNIAAVLLIYPIPFVRYFPLRIAEMLGSVASRRRWIMPTYGVGLFVLVPMAAVALG